MSKESLNFLILHNMREVSRWIVSVADIELALPQYAPQHNYLIHNALLPVPEHIIDIQYDAIILNSTFIDLLSTPQGYKKVNTDYAFLKNNPAYTVALPQDDYWCSEIRDKWFTDCKINRVHPVISKEHWKLFYPRFSSSGGRMALGYTGYITPQLRRRTTDPKEYASRKTDVIYRSKKIPLFPNKIGNLKGSIGDIFIKAVSGESLVLDISTNAKDKIQGPAWYDFIENSKATLGSNSGSSLHVRNHQVIHRIRNYMLKNPGHCYEDIETACFLQDDAGCEFTAISPRNLEAGLLRTLQILVPGPYSDILLPGQHYIPLAEDCSNIEKVLEILRNDRKAEIITNNCRETLLSFQPLQVESFVEQIEQSIYEGLPLTHKSVPREKFNKLVEQYREKTSGQLKIYNLLASGRTWIKDSLPPKAADLLQRLKLTFTK